ncbi:MAG: hypothetical protein RJA00_1304 [Bacteroidota bacterium]|jgi:hypothetical protein|nr:hypothetical protein [Bacteroidota bacterium]NBX64655.1 hypothetical protein [Bacteroidota bacterium]
MISPIIGWYFKQRVKELRANIERSLENQNILFGELMEKLSLTEYGRKFGIEKLTTYQQFAERVPVASFEDFLPYIERNQRGEQSLLWPGDIRWFAKSSGTTSNVSKFIPMSYEIMEHNHFEGSKEAVTQFFGFYPEGKIFGGKGLLIGGTTKQNEGQDYYFGDLSGILMVHLPSWANWKSTPDVEVATLESWEEKLEKMVEIIKDEDVTSVSGVPTWTAVVMQRVLEVTGKQNILEVWPNFELFIHGGVNFEPYREQFKAFLPSSQVKYLETYNASEGFFGIQYQADRSELVLLTHLGIFFEFYPATEVPSIHNIVPLSAVKPGINYAVIISTVGGLWRYIIGDTIQFHGLNPFTFKITGRTKLFINAFGEELVIENAETAIAMACKELDAIVTDYTAAPVYLDQNENPGHEWLIEFAKPPADLKAFTELLDRELQRTNDDYKGKRAGDMLMKMPQVIAVPTLTFHDWLKSKGKLGGQNKVPRLSNDRKIIEEIKGMIGL